MVLCLKRYLVTVQGWSLLGSMVDFGRPAMVQKPNNQTPMEQFYFLAAVREKIGVFFRIARFLLTSSNGMVAYHRQVCFAAILPLLFGASVNAAYSTGYLHTLFLRRAVRFIFLLAFCYSAAIVRTKLLPRRKTFEQWNTYMSSVKHSRHVHAILMAFHRQISHGDAPAEGTADHDAADVPAETYHLWKTKHHGLSSEQVMTKYVNFCWRYAYRLWCNKISLLVRKDASVADSTQGLTVQNDSLHSVNNQEPHGDHSVQGEAAERLLPHDDYIKLRLLERLADRVGKYATVLQGDSGSSSADEQGIANQQQEEDPIYKHLKAHIQTHEHAS